MTATNVLTNPPVIEAIIDFVFQTELSASDFSKINSFFQSSAEKSEKFNGFEVKIQNKENEMPSVKKVNDGSTRHFFSSSSFVVLVKLNGITFSMLRPYRGFDYFSNLVKEECGKLKLNEICQIKRVGVRYVNVFIAPVKSEYVNEYLNFLPTWPSDIKTQPTDFVSRVSLPLPDLLATCILTQTSLPLADGKSVQVAVDIDLFRIYASELQLDSIWGDLVNLKAKLNQLFFRTISRKALDLFL